MFWSRDFHPEDAPAQLLLYLLGFLHSWVAFHLKWNLILMKCLLH